MKPWRFLQKKVKDGVAKLASAALYRVHFQEMLQIGCSQST